MATKAQVQAGRARRGKKVKNAPSIGDLKQNYYNNKPLPNYSRPAAKKTVYKSSSTNKDTGGTARRKTNVSKKTASTAGRITNTAKKTAPYSAPKPNESGIKRRSDTAARAKAAKRYQTDRAGIRDRAMTLVDSRQQSTKKNTRSLTSFTGNPVGDSIQKRRDRVNRKIGDARRMTQNSYEWHFADEERKKKLNLENDAIRAKYGYSYSPQSGVTYDKNGKSLSAQIPEAVKQAKKKHKRETEQWNKPTPKGFSRALDTIEASMKSVMPSIDKAGHTSKLASYYKAQKKFFKGENLNPLERLSLQDRWGGDWKSKLTKAKEAYRTGDIAKIQEFEKANGDIDKLQDPGPVLEQNAMQREKAKQDLTGPAKVGLDLLGIGADMLGSFSLASVAGPEALPTAFTTVSSIGAAGNAAQNAEKLGADIEKQNKYAKAAGILNLATESLGGIGGSRAIEGAAHKLLPNAAKNILSKADSSALGRIAANAAQEGFEEGIQSEGERELRNKILGTKEKYNPAEVIKSIGYGAAAGGIFGAGQAIGLRHPRTASQNAPDSSDGVQQYNNTPEQESPAKADSRPDIPSPAGEPVRPAREPVKPVPETEHELIRELVQISTDIQQTELLLSGPMRDTRLAKLRREFDTVNAELLELREGKNTASRSYALENREPTLTAPVADVPLRVETPKTQAPGPEPGLSEEAPEASVRERYYALENPEPVITASVPDVPLRVKTPKTRAPGPDTSIPFKGSEPVYSENILNARNIPGIQTDTAPHTTPVLNETEPPQIQNMPDARQNQNKTSAIKGAGKYFYRNIVSGQAEIEKLAKVQEKINPNNASANDLVQINRSAGSTVDTIAQTTLVDRKGDAIGDGWLNTIGKLTDEQRKLINLYRQHLNNIDRMSLYERSETQRAEARNAYEQFLSDSPEFNTLTEYEVNRRARAGSALAQDYIELKNYLNRMQSIYDKPVLGHPDGTQDIPYTADESRKIAAELEAANPWLKEYTQKAENFHDAFMKEWAVGSGLMSEQQFNALKEKYPHYVQTYRSREKWGDADTTRHGKIDAASPIKDAVGDLSEIVPFEDAEMIQVNSIVKSARRNELFRNIYDFAKTNPSDAAPYVRITGEDVDYEAPDNIEDFANNISRDSMSDQGGIFTIRVMIDGAPKIMQVSSDFYAGLQNLFGQDRGASDSFLSKTAGKLTTGFKIFTTGKNPLFFLTNLPKDFQTAFINTTSGRKLLHTYLWDVLGSLRSMMSNSNDWRAFQALGGSSSSFYHNEKGFTQSTADAKKHRIIKTLCKPVDTISENTEALWRFNEYRAAVKKYGDTHEGRVKAIQAAADVTTNFSRSGPATKAAENYCAYLNAGVQGLDKIARQLKNHPLLTTGRAAEIIALPTFLLWLINKDDEDYKNLNNRTKDNYYCINTKYLTRKDEGKFLKIPKSREYGVAMGALLERFFRLGEGGEGEMTFKGFAEQFKKNIAQGEEREKAFKDIGGQFLTNLAPSNPVTDNIFKTAFIDLPTNRDFAGRAIIPERMLGLSPKNQYDYNTSGAGFALSKAWNATAGRLGPQLAPIQADYLLDSNLGFVGDAIIGATTNPKSPKEFLQSVKEKPSTLVEPILNTLEQKFIADPLYQSGVTDDFYDELDKAERAANDKNLEENIPSEYKTPEEKYLSKLNEASDNISELRKQERSLLADRSISDDERESKVRDIRRQIIEIAKAAPAEALKAKQEYEKIYVPETSELSENRQEDAREAKAHGVDPSVFAAWEEKLSALINEEDSDGKHVRSEKEAISMVLDELMNDNTLSDAAKQAIADYQLTSVLDGEKEKETWEKLRGIVNATDFLKFKTDVAKYLEEAKNTGQDNAANVANMLRDYGNLNDNQRDRLFQAYSDNMSKNPFHISEYERNIDTNDAFYSSLNDDGKAQLRSLLNEYEQKTSEGKELKGWLSKASEAQEAGIRPQTYAMYRVALSMSDQNNDGRYKQEEAQNAINSLSGLTQQQKAYLYQSTNPKWKKNPFGSVGALEDTGEDIAEEQESGLKAEGTLYNSHGLLKAEFLGKASGDPQAAALSSTRKSSVFTWPTPGNVSSSSAYGWRVHPIYGTNKFHSGEDIPAPSGAPIVAAASGTVVSAGWAQGYGNYTVIDHGNGLRTAYGHQSSIGVQPGQQVKAGQQIGRVGSTGNSTGPHLHFEVYVNGETQNPMSYFGETTQDSTQYPVSEYSGVDYSQMTAAPGGKASGSSIKTSKRKNVQNGKSSESAKNYAPLPEYHTDTGTKLDNELLELPSFRSLMRLRRLHRKNTAKIANL